LPPGTALAPALAFAADKNTGIYSPGADQVAVATNGVGRLFVDDQGRVGVGAAAVAGVNFNVQGSTPILRVTGASATNPTFQLSAAGVTSWSQVVDASNSAFYISKDGTERLRITSAGLVGIGTSTPNSYNSDANDLVVASTGNMGLTLASTDSGSSNIYFADGTVGDQAYRGVLSYSHSTDSMRLWTAAATRMAIDSSGRVGIGTTTPSSSLHVNDAATIQARLTSSAASTGIIFSDANTTDSVTIGTVGDELRFRTDQGAYTFRTNNGTSEAVRIDSSGRLLVGTSSDSGGALLQVNGDRIRIATAKTPASAADTGTAGEICWDADYIYVCTATNTWKRTAISTW
jgi:hypothetical protein